MHRQFIPAKPRSDNPHDYDPIMKKDAQILISDATMMRGPLSSFPASSFPRNLPIAGLFREEVKAETFLADDKPHITHLPSEFDSAIEMSYRLSLIPDDAIDKVIDDWYMKVYSHGRIDVIDYVNPKSEYNDIWAQGDHEIKKEINNRAFYA